MKQKIVFLFMLVLSCMASAQQRFGADSYSSVQPIVFLISECAPGNLINSESVSWTKAWVANFGSSSYSAFISHELFDLPPRAQTLPQSIFDARQNTLTRFNRIHVPDSNKICIEQHPDSMRKIWSYSFLYGLTDVASALSYKINTEYAIGIKWAAYYMSGSGSSSIGFNSGSGIGVKLARSFQYKIFNTINCEYLFIYRITNYTRAYPVLKGGALEVNVGYENKHTGGFVWAIGAVLNSGKTAPLLVLPIIKIGFIVNI